MGEIRLSQREQARLLVLNALNRGALKMAEAARLVGLSVRQLRRLRRAYRLRGAAALAHGNRGRPSPRRLPDALHQRIVRLARTTYAAVNHQHFTELLREREGLRVSRQTVSRLLHAAGVPSPRRRRPPKHRTRRERMPQAGMLVQFDGSQHAWLEDRGPRLVLHAAVDDATNKILAAWFDDEETAAGYFHVFRQVALTVGIPLAAYTDRHGIFKRAPNARWTLDEQLQGARMPTQVGRLLQELGIQWIPASSPQAKGRIERVFGALQDRLVVELRLAGITDKAAANAFLPRFLRRYNTRFARSAAQPRRVFRPWPTTLAPNTVFCFKYTRTVANDHTVTLGPHTLQLLPNGRSYAKSRVDVHEHLDGTFTIVYHGTRVPVRPLTAAGHAQRIRVHERQRVRSHQAPPRRRDAAQPPRIRNSPQRAKPAANHPWRQYDQVRKLKAARALRTKSLGF
jgi:transposase